MGDWATDWSGWRTSSLQVTGGRLRLAELMAELIVGLEMVTVLQPGLANLVPSKLETDLQI